MLDHMSISSNYWPTNLVEGNIKSNKPRPTHRTSPRSSMSNESPASMSRRHKVTVACAACKSRKSRCSGSSPCEACVTLGTECVIDETLDGRRKVALNRRLDELVHNKLILQGLLLSLRTSKDGPLVNLLDRINADASLPVLASTIAQALARSPELAAQAAMNPFLLDQNNRRITQSTGRVRNKHNDAFAKSSNEFIDPFTLSQKLEEFARSNSVTEMHNDLTHTAESSFHDNRYVNAQQYLIDASNPDGVSANYSLTSGNTYLTHRRSQTVDASSDDVSLDNVVLWLKGVSIQNDAKISGMAADHLAVLPHRDSAQASWHPSIVHQATPSHDHREQHESHRRAIKQETARSEIHRKRALSTAYVPPRPSPRSTFHESSSSSSSLQVSSAPTSMHESFSMSSAGMSSVSFNIDNPWNHQPVLGHATLPKTEIDDSPMARAISCYLDLARSNLTRGTPLLEVFGPEKPSVDLLFRERRHSDLHSVCNFAAELTSGIEGLALPEKLAMTHMFTYLMRWMVLPSTENYSRIPEMYRPTIAQITISHSPLVEFCPIPQLRDSLCYQKRDFLSCLAPNISCNWVFQVESCIEKDPSTGNLCITDAFCRQITMPESWTLKAHRDVLTVFPESAGFVHTIM